MNELFLGVDIGGTKIGVSLGNRKGEILARKQFPTSGKPADIIHRIISSGKGLMEERHLTQFQSIGVSCGGPLDTVHGEILSPPHLPFWDQVPITRRLEEAFNAPAYLQNDANACALAEWNWGSGQGTRNMIFLTFGTGFGAGLILDGKLYEGASGMAGEIGHVRIAPTGPYCYGKNGSIESFCSGAGLSLLFEQEFGEKISAKEICLRANMGDERSKRVIAISAERLGYALSILIDVLNPEKIVMGSIYARDEILFRHLMQEIIDNETLPQCNSVCSVIPSSLGDDIGDIAALGVAKSFWERTLHDERTTRSTH